MKDINDLINGIKGQDELMSMEDVGKLTSNTKIGTSAYAWSKLALLAVAFLAIISATVVLWPSGKSENKTVLETPIVNDTETIEMREELATKEADSPAQNLMVGSQSTSEIERKSGLANTVNNKNLPRQNIDNPRTAASQKGTGHIESNQLPTNLNTAKQTTLDTTNEQIVLTKINTIRNNANEEALDKESAKNQKDGRSIYPASEKFYYESWSKEPQSYKVNLAKSNVLKGKEGTIVIIPPGAICGTYESFSANVELTEYYSREDMLNGQLTTASHGDMLESAGMIELRASANGKPLKLCKELTILFPSAKYQDTGYIGFNGVWDDNHNTIDWALIDGVNNNFFGGIATPNCDRPTYQAIRRKWPTQKTELKKKGKSNQRKAYRKDEVIRKIRKRFWFQDSITSKLYDEVYDGIKYTMSDTLSASAYNACLVSRAKALVLQNFLDSLRGGGEILFDPNILNQQTGYILASVSNLGMINCDRFTNYKDTRNHTYKVGESDGEVSSRLIFRDFNAMLPGKTKNKSYVQFSKIPAGERATLLVIKYLDDNIQIAYDEITIGEEPILNFIVVDKKEVPKVLEAVANGKKYRIDPKIAKVPVSKSTESGKLAVSPGILENAIVLTKEELEKFYIFQYDDVLLYSRFSKDKRDVREMALMKTYGRQFSRSGNHNQLNMKTDHPILVSAPKSQFYLERDQDIEAISSETHIPIFVPFDRNGTGYCIFWFSKTAKNTDKLNLEQREKLQLISLNHETIFDDSLNITTIIRAPTDTIVKQKSTKPYWSNQFFEADKQMLEALNIKISPKRIRYFKNKFRPSRLISYKRDSFMTSIIHGSDFSDRKMKNTPPSFITTQDIKNNSSRLDITELISRNNQSTNSRQYFHSHKHKMVAIKVDDFEDQEIVFWYENTKRILELLNFDQRNRASKHLDITRTLEIPNTPSKEIERKLMFDQLTTFVNLKELQINPIVLTPQQLKKYHISSNPGKVLFSIYNVNNTLTLNFTFTKKLSTTAFLPQDSISTEANILPKYISDKYGKSYRMKLTPDTDSTFDLQKLIPIYVNANDEYHLSDFFYGYSHPDCIFWYKPTDEFLALLPQDIRKQLSYELALISDATQTPSQLTTENHNNSTPEIESCVYLDPCSDIKTNITDMVLFPNPTKGIVNVSISLSKSVGGDIKVTNLTGQPFLEKRLEDCSVQSTLDVSHLPAGLYLVTLLSDDGDKITRRVIRE